MTQERGIGSPKSETCGCGRSDCLTCRNPSSKVFQKQNHRRRWRELSVTERHGRVRMDHFHVARLREGIRKVRDEQRREDREVKLFNRESEPLDA